jgi:hypothetical protein
VAEESAHEAQNVMGQAKENAASRAAPIAHAGDGWQQSACKRCRLPRGYCRRP